MNDNEKLISRLLDREVKEANIAVSTIAGCMDKDRKESRLANAKQASNYFSKLITNK